MTLKRGVGIVVIGTALGLAGAAMFYTVDDTDQLLKYGGRALHRVRGSLPSVSLGSGTGRGQPWCDLSVVAVGSPAARALNVNARRGAVVVSAGGRARRSGFQVGDVIVGVDGKRIDRPADLDAGLCAQRAAGAPLLVDVRRGRTSSTLVLAGGGNRGRGAVRVALPQKRSRATAASRPGLQLVCPRDGRTLSAAGARPPFLCPRCGGPMQWNANSGAPR